MSRSVDCHSRGVRGLLAAYLLTAACGLARAEKPVGTDPLFAQRISITDPAVVLAPYVWKPVGDREIPMVEACLPGAYLRVEVQGTRRVQLLIDGTTNAGCPRESMPVVESSIDERPFVVVPLTITDREYALPLATDLTSDEPHRIDVYFRASDLTCDRWTSPKTHLRLIGLGVDETGIALPRQRRPRLAIGFGDSITEGVGGDGLFTSWQKLEVNNARATWLPFVCRALDCEYGQLGCGGQGMVRGLNLPSLQTTWERYDDSLSRLSAGRLFPPPDFVFCAHGTNDFEKDITDDYAAWLSAVRTACPEARIFCIVPPLGLHRDEIVAAVTRRRSAGDVRVHLIDTAPLEAEFRVGQGPTRLAADGVHPTVEGQAHLAALILREVERVEAADDASAGDP